MKLNILIIIVFFIIIILSIILLSKFKIKIYKRSQGKGIITIKYNFIKIKEFDIGQSISKMMETHLMSSNIKNAINNLRIMIDNDLLLKELLSQIVVKKIILIPKYNIEDPTVMPYVSVINWSIISLFKRLLSDYFKKVESEYYQIYIYDESKKGIDLELELEIIGWRLLKTILKHFPSFKTMIKRFKKEGKIYGNNETTSE